MESKIKSKSQAASIILSILGVILGLVLLQFGSDFFVKGSIQMAEILGVDERIIGLTIVALGTSLPELATVVMATMRKQSDLAIGNLIGSNIFNLVGILGLAALMKPFSIESQTLHYDMPWLLGVSIILLIGILAGKRIGRIKGTLYMAVYAGYAYSLFRMGSRFLGK